MPIYNINGSAVSISEGGYIPNFVTVAAADSLEKDKLSALAALKPGAGELVCKAMQSLIPQQQITLEVASANEKAVRLYERLGFLKTQELSRWYRVK